MTVKSSERPPEKTCNTDGCNAWATKQSDRTQCRHHGGESTGAPENNANNGKHFIHASVETFLEHADEHHKDTYHAAFESLCSRYERFHGYEPDFDLQKKLKEIAKDIAAEDMALEYMKGKAPNKELPLTEQNFREVGDKVVESEEIANTWDLLNQLSRKHRQWLKDMGLLHDPESQNADATQGLISVLSENRE